MIVFLSIAGKIDLFWFEMEDMEKLWTEQETSGRDLPFGMDKAWYGIQI